MTRPEGKSEHHVLNLVCTDFQVNKEMRKLLLNAENILEEIIKRLEYDRQLYENFSDDDAEEKKLSKRIMILDEAIEEINKELRGK